MKGPRESVLIAVALLISACSAQAPKPSVAAAPAATPLPTAAAGRSANPLPTVAAGIDPFAPPASDLMRVDQQGAVTVEVTPADLSEASDILEFEISLNTHSVDLSMDLAALTTLSTDTGLTIPAVKWDAPRGGHHVSGTLSFPADHNGRSILAGVHRLTLSIADLAGFNRTFEWDLN